MVVSADSSSSFVASRGGSGVWRHARRSADASQAGRLQPIANAQAALGPTGLRFDLIALIALGKQFGFLTQALRLFSKSSSRDWTRSKCFRFCMAHLRICGLGAKLHANGSVPWMEHSLTFRSAELEYEFSVSNRVESAANGRDVRKYCSIVGRSLLARLTESTGSAAKCRSPSLKFAPICGGAAINACN